MSVAPPGAGGTDGATRGWIALVLLAALSFAGGLRRINDLDYWTHLALGRAYVQAGSILVPEPFHAVAASPAPRGELGRLADAFVGSGEWPFQLALYATRSALGDAGVCLAIAACAALAVFLLAAPLRRAPTAGRLSLGLAFAASALFVARFRFSPRPEAAGAVLLGALLPLAYRWGERPRWRVLAAMAAVLVAWMPVHVTWAIGAALAGVALAARPRLDFWRSRSRAALAALGGAALLLSWPVVRFAAFVLGELRGGGRLLGVTEMRPAWEFPSVLLPFLAVSAAGVLLAWGGREGRVARLAVWGAAFALGLLVVRNVGLAALAMIPGAARGLAAPPAGPERPWRGRAAVACAAAVVALLAGAVARDRDYPAGVGVDWRHFPRDAAELVRASPLEEPVFNTWSWGGYLAWAWGGTPRTFLDGRLYDRARVSDHDAIAAGDPRPVLERRGFRTALLQPIYMGSGRLLPAVGWFLSHPDWRLVHAGDALVFARAPLPPGVAEASAADAWRLVLRQADLADEQNDLPPHAEYTRAIAFLGLGERDRAAAAFERAVRRAPSLAARYGPLGQALAARSR